MKKEKGDIERGMRIMNKCRYRKQRCMSCRRYCWKKEMSRSNPHLCQSCEKRKRIIENINNNLKED